MNFREIMLQLIQEQHTVNVFPATVKTVDRQQATCDVQPLEQAAPLLLDVQLRAVEDGSSTGLILWPKVDSVVLIGLIGNDINTAYVVACSEVDTITVSNETESLLTILQDLISEIRAMKFTTNNGPTIQLLNTLQFEALAKRLPKLLS